MASKQSTETLYIFKRFKLALTGVILCMVLAVIGMIIGQYDVVTAAVGGISAICVSYVAGDSYRQSTYDNFDYYANPNKIQE